MSPSKATDITKSNNMSFDDLLQYLAKPRLDLMDQKLVKNAKKNIFFFYSRKSEINCYL